MNINLWITHRFHTKEAIYGCMGAAVMISGAIGGLRFAADFVYQMVGCFTLC